MRLVHLSDLHLGYRQYQRLTPGGVNQREADVAATFRTAIDRIIAIAPDVVVIAGDVFHSVRPTNQAILHAFNQFARLKRELPNTDVILIAGNHDTPRSAETGGILPLFSQIGLYIVDREVRRLAFPARDLSLLCIPDVHGLVIPSLTTDSSARFNVLACHGEVPGTLPENVTRSDPAAVQISREELVAGRWDYVAMGHYHVYREVAPNIYYSGSIEYTSLNTWGELHEQRVAKLGGKGFIEHDLATGEHTFHELPPARPLVDLYPSLQVGGMPAADVDAAIRKMIDACPGGIDDKIVRLVVRDMTRSLARELDHRAIRDYKRRALAFNLDLRPPDIHPGRSANGAPGKRPSLAEIVREKLSTRDLTPGVDRDLLIEKAIGYLDETQLTAVAPTMTEF